MYLLKRIVILICPMALALTLISCASAPKSTVTGTKPYTVRGQKYYPLQSAHGFVEEGVASWYGPGFHGKLTANGETYNQNAMTAAHKLLPLGTTVRVTNLENGNSLVLRINDRGPFVHDRVIDVSKRAAERLDMQTQGVARVRIEAINTKASSNLAEAATGLAAATGVGTGGSSASSGASSKDALAEAKESRVLNSEGEIPDELKYLFEEEGSHPVQSTALAAMPASVEEFQEQVVEHIYEGDVAENIEESLPSLPQGVGDFYVQFGDFSVKKMASLLAAKLESQGYPARSYKEAGESLWRVRVGPWSTAERAAEFLPKFAQQFANATVVLAEPKQY